MVFVLIIWVYTLALCYIYGSFFLKNTPLSLTLLAGLVGLTVVAEFFSIAIQIGWIVQLIILAGAFWLVAKRHVAMPRFSFLRKEWLFLVLCITLLLLLENATHRPENPDTNIYHAQAIHWIESYPAVPGLGNLHGRLAFDSAWLVANALFSFSFLGIQSFHLIGSVLFLIALLFFWQGFLDLRSRTYRPSAFLKVLLLPVSFYVLGSDISSPGTDLPVSLLIWLIAILWAERVEAEKPYHTPLIVLLAAFAVTVKLSAAPLLIVLVPLFVLHWRRGQKRLVVGLLGVVLLVFIPFFTRNIILSGYLVYPFPAIDLFNFDWKVPAARAVSEQRAIIAWGRLPNNAGAAAMPLRAWFPEWLARQTLNRRLTFFLALLTPVPALIGFLRKTPQRLFWLGWLVMYGGVFFWFFSSPDFRFGYGFLCAALLMALAPWLSPILKRWPFARIPATALLVGLVSMYLLATLVLSFQATTLTSYLLLPADYDHVPTDNCSLANGSVFCAQAYNACSYFAFPCIPSPRSWVEFRGTGLQNGFRPVPSN